MAKKTELLSDAELQELTKFFQPDSYSKDLALELVFAMVLSTITEPGDRMAGALARTLGKETLIDLLVEGFDSRSVLNSLSAKDAFFEIERLFGDVEQTINDSRQRWLPRLSKSAVIQNFQNSQALGLNLLTHTDTSWPQGLDDLQDGAPAMLFVEGQKNVLGSLQSGVAIVGSRSASQYGLEITDQIVSELATVSRPTVSGGAIGIDARAHQASNYKNLSTVAVMAGGLNRKYPSANFPLFHQIKVRGAIISELAPGVAPSRWRFLQRNRLIAALTPTTIVVEAGFRSGSIRTANNALELDRELLAVPGSVLSKTSAGTNSLIASGKAVALNEISSLNQSGDNNSFRSESEISTRCHDAIRELGIASQAQIAKIAGLTEFEVSVAISELNSGNLLLQDHRVKGLVHYALKHGN
jgi:DNA processing protein